jgi:hypothetical protein
MSEDIGPRDVVTRSRPVMRGPAIPEGARYVVEEAYNTKPGCAYSALCGPLELVLGGLGGGWCYCGWRKIGGSKSDTVRRFAEELTPARPKVDV